MMAGWDLKAVVLSVMGRRLFVNRSVWLEKIDIGGYRILPSAKSSTFVGGSQTCFKYFLPQVSKKIPYMLFVYMEIFSNFAL